jgi:hypothetical protein
LAGFFVVLLAVLLAVFFRSETGFGAVGRREDFSAIRTIQAYPKELMKTPDGHS